MPHFWARKNVQKPKDRALSFAHSFLGVRIECAQCHKHPFDQWTKTDYEQFQQFFEPLRYDANLRRDPSLNFATVTKELREKTVREMQMREAQSTEIRRRIEAGEIIPIHEVYVTTRNPRSTIARIMKNARAYSGRVLTPKLLGGEQVLIKEYSDPREPLMQWLRSRDNPFFARAFVNRVWAAYFHRGLVEPADDLNLANPPVNSALMAHLEAEFVSHGYDMRHLHCLILSSDTYQRFWNPTATNERDERNFSRIVLRRLPAEVLLDAMTLATAATSRQRNLAAYVKNRQIGPNVAAFGLAEAFAGKNMPDHASVIFGKSRPETNCDCERASVPTLLQSLYTRNDPEMLERIEGRGGDMPTWITELRTAGQKPGDTHITEAFLRTLSRSPTGEELHKAPADLAAAKEPLAGLRDLLWALLNTREFSVNHRPGSHRQFAKVKLAAAEIEHAFVACEVICELLRNAVVAVLAILLGLFHQARLPEHSQMFGDVVLSHLQLFSEIIYAERLLHQRTDEAQSAFFAERLHRGDAVELLHVLPCR